MPKFYETTITITAVVQADNATDAYLVTRDQMREIFRDIDHPDITVGNRIGSVKDLPKEWDGMCLPYGGDGNTRLKDLLPVKDQA